MVLTPGNGLNLTQQVAHYLGKAIISGEFGDHNPVPSEAELCKQLTVSRSAAREAVKSLELESERIEQQILLASMAPLVGNEQLEPAQAARDGLVELLGSEVASTVQRKAQIDQLVGALVASAT